MRIQHNIMAMNAYRNYSNNTSALSKNLEKLSSGYKINRAGDDAAGLAISEKMRAQITGLDVAQKNAKDGISLVQTAEGALTEVHDMLNRMVELASQSANGTYDATDRTQLQKEVSQLRDEIDRIADSANFNGIKLLDGSLEENGMKTVELTGLGTVTTDPAGAASIASAKSILGSLDAAGEKITVSFSTKDGSAYSVSLSMKDANTLVDEATGKEYSYATASSAADVTAALNTALSNATGGAFTASVDATTGALTITSDAKGAGAPELTSLTVLDQDGNGVDLGALTKTDATAELINIADTNYNVVADGTTATASDVFSINGQKFAILETDDALEASKEALGDEVNILVAADLHSAAAQLAQATGLDIKANAGNTGIEISTSSGSALTLQIGDTSDDFNQLEVKVGDMHANALGIGGINIGTQDGAAAAISSIKYAINKVSDVRGTLGATQNRLDHTMNNLSVMEENIQDAESAIRDTDVADEMMEYTKNNILIQSAQAMLAQANQVPQGVLQLLQ